VSHQAPYTLDVVARNVSFALTMPFALCASAAYGSAFPAVDWSVHAHAIGGFLITCLYLWHRARLLEVLRLLADFGLMLMFWSGLFVGCVIVRRPTYALRNAYESSELSRHPGCSHWGTGPYQGIDFSIEPDFGAKWLIWGLLLGGLAVVALLWRRRRGQLPAAG
jgi:hypothetical protein